MKICVYTGIGIVGLLLGACSGQKARQSLAGNWIEVMPANPQIRQGITLRTDGSASSIGMATLQYERWQEHGKALILWGKSIGNGQTIDFSDTLDIVKVTSDSLILGKYGMYRIAYYKVAEGNPVKSFDLLDSLRQVEGLTELQTREYSGRIPDQSGLRLPCRLTIYNYKHCGDGVWQLTFGGAEADRSQRPELFGRMYTLRGDAVNRDAVVYQMVPFGGGKDLFFRYLGEKLELLNQNLERQASDSTQRNTLVLQ